MSDTAGYPRNCGICGKPVRVKDNAWYHHDGKQGYTWHIECRLELRAKPSLRSGVSTPKPEAA